MALRAGQGREGEGLGVPVFRLAPWSLAAVASALCALWLLTRPYGGLRGDAAIYLGRAVADLDPSGIGRELEFAHDAQSGFSLFPAIARMLVGGLGAGPAAEVLTLAGLIAWIAAAAWLVSRRLSGAGLLAALVALVVMPADYGYSRVFSFGEAMATARPLAEAAALVSLGLFLDGRRIAAAAAMALAAAIHPLMAAPVAAIVWILLAMQDRRWLFAGLAGAFAAAAAAALGAPVAKRLFETFDPAWRAIIRIRTAPVFVLAWPESAWGLLACQLATGLMVAGLRPDLRRLALAAAGVAVAGIAVALWPSVLIAQLQTWRAAWPLAVLAAAGLPIVAPILWGQGVAGRSALALIAVAWLVRDSLPAAGLAAALALWLALKPPARAIPRLVGVAIVAAAGSVVLTVEALKLAATLARAGADLRSPSSRVLDLDLHTIVLVGLACAVAIRPPRLTARTFELAAAATSALLLAGAVFLWDDRSAFQRWAETPGATAQARAAFRPGQVFWTAGYGESWLVTGRPEWWSPLQGGGLVFDRDLAMRWASRRALAMAAGQAPKAGRVTEFGAAALDRLCRSPDGPDEVVAPTAALQPGLQARASAGFTTPALHLVDANAGRGVTVDRFAVFDCRK